jgi:hypothetical protein
MVVVVRVRVALLKDPRPMTPWPEGITTFDRNKHIGFNVQFLLLVCDISEIR